MTTDLALGDQSGRHPLQSAEPDLAYGEPDLAMWARALRLAGPRLTEAWSGRRRREFSLVRAHLAPIRSRPALAASFGRESFHRASSEAAQPDITLLTSPVLAAYAMRWLELPDG